MLRVDRSGALKTIKLSLENTTCAYLYDASRLGDKETTQDICFRNVRGGPSAERYALNEAILGVAAQQFSQERTSYLLKKS